MLLLLEVKVILSTPSRVSRGGKTTQDGCQGRRGMRGAEVERGLETGGETLGLVSR